MYSSLPIRLCFRFLIWLAPCVFVTPVFAQLHFDQTSNGFWDGYSALMPYQSISTFDPLPGGCGFDVSQFQLFEANRSSTGAMNGFNSSRYNTADAISAVEAGNYIWFDVAAVTDTVYLDSVILLLRKSNTGPTNTQLSYATNTSADADYTTLASVTDLTAGTAVEFSLVSDIPLVIYPGETYRFRMVSWGASNTTGTIRIKNQSYISGYTASHEPVADTARFREPETTIDTVKLCGGATYTVDIASTGIGDTVFYRKIVDGSAVSSHHALVPSSGIINIIHDEGTDGWVLYIIDSTRSMDLCRAIGRYSDSLLIINNSNHVTHRDTIVQLCLGDILYWEGFEFSETATYSLTFDSESGCDSIVYYTASVTLLSEASTEGFDFVPSIFTNPLEVRFEPIAPYGVSEYFWDFGDGGISDEMQPVHYFDSFGLYHVTLRVSNACGTTSTSLDIYVKPANTSVESPGLNYFNIYPVPAIEQVTVENKNVIKWRKIYISDVMGRVVLAQSTGDEKNIQINCSAWSPGVYVVLIVDDNGQTYTHKIMII